MLRLSDEAETALNLARPSELGAAARVARWRSSVTRERAADVAARRDAGAELLSSLGASPARASAGAAWERDRYRGPYLRDALLDAGALVETLETVAFWSRAARRCIGA